MASKSSKTGNQIEEPREEGDILLTNLICPSNGRKVPRSVPTDCANQAKMAWENVKEIRKIRRQAHADG
jgi:hypothetical protein